MRHAKRFCLIDVQGAAVCICGVACEYVRVIMGNYVCQCVIMSARICRCVINYVRVFVLRVRAWASTLSFSNIQSALIT